MSANFVTKLSGDQSTFADELASGSFTMEVLAPHQETQPRRISVMTDLRVRVALADLQQFSVLDFSPHFMDFVRSGSKDQIYGDHACLTIEKFGTALQFKERVRVRFKRQI